MSDQDEFVARVVGREPVPPYRRYTGRIHPEQWSGGTNVHFDHATVHGLELRRQRFWSLSSENTRFEDCDFRGASFDSGSWSGARQTRFVACRFDGADLRTVLVGNCRFERCDFTDARIDDWLTQATEFIDCTFAGRIMDARFAGRPWGFWEEAGQIEPARSVNEFRGNDFRRAELLGCDFAWGIEIGEQAWPSGAEYVRLDRWPERVARARHEFMGWPETERQEAMIVLSVYSEAGYEYQDEIFVNRYTSGAPPALADRIWGVLASVLT